MKPVAAFDFEHTGVRKVNLINLSQHATAYQWAYKTSLAGVTQNAATPDLEITFLEDGTFTVTLTATNLEGASSASLQLLVNADVVTLGIESLIKLELPEDVTIPPLYQFQRIKYWQSWLQPRLTSLEILPEDTYNQIKWPMAANSLIAKLVIHDSIRRQSTKAVMSGSMGKGGLKRLETGPSVAEWFNANEFWSGLGKEGGLYSLLLTDLCQLGHDLGILLPMCPARNISVPFIVGKKDHIDYGTTSL